MSLQSEVKWARERYPNQPLVLLEIDGDARAAPIGHLFSFTGSVDSVRIIGLMDADGSITVPADSASGDSNG